MQLLLFMDVGDVIFRWFREDVIMLVVDRKSLNLGSFLLSPCFHHPAAVVRHHAASRELIQIVRRRYDEAALGI